MTNPLAIQFSDLHQQRRAAELGMWVFIGSEVMFFGVLFLAYTVYRFIYPGAFAEGSQHLNAVIGTLNTAILISSSFTVALAVFFMRINARNAVLLCLALTIAFAAAFMLLKAYEWHHHYEEKLFPGLAFQYPSQPGDNRGVDPAAVKIFFVLYFIMTGLHGLHVLIGMAIFLVMFYLTAKNRFSTSYHTPVEISALYWHFVDIVWIFLWPLLYLIDLHGGK
jgi:cytochrome c oxidase subunit 3